MTILDGRQQIEPADRIVVDLGCASWQTKDGGYEDSIVTLIRRFRPKVLFGFDPVPEMQDGVGIIQGTLVMTAQRAAWTRTDIVGYTLQNNCSHVYGEDAKTVCFDTATFLKSLPGVETILKIDIEGAEYELIPHLLREDALRNVKLMLVEWHTDEYANGWSTEGKDEILSKLPCQVEDWH